MRNPTPKTIATTYNLFFNILKAMYGRKEHSRT